MSHSTVMRMRRYRAREKDMCELGARERTYTSLARKMCFSLARYRRKRISVEWDIYLSFSLSRDVADSFEAVTLRQ